MPYDRKLAERVRMVLQSHTEMVEMKMFGGVGFILRGNLACGVQGDELIIRLGENKNDFALSQPFTRPFMPVRGRPMVGWILVAPGGTASEQDLVDWVSLGVEFALTLPEKK